MSDTENPTDEQSEAEESAGTDAADLKARLGLRTRKRRIARPTGSSLGGGDAAGAGEGETSEDAFHAFGNDKTPAPQPLPVSTEDFDGAGKIATKPLIIMLLVVSAVALFLGSVLGGSLEQQGLREGHALYAKLKLDALTGAKTKTGAELMPALVTFRKALKTASKSLGDASVAKTGGEKLRTDTLKTVMAEIKTFSDDGVFVSPERLMDDIMVLYKDDELLAAVRFAVKTRHLHDLATAATTESRAYDKMAMGPFLAARVKAGGKAGASKGVLIRRTEREIPELGKIPAAEGSWILDTGKPRQVKLVDKNRPSNATERWEMMVVEVGKTADEAVQVPTSDVMTLDMTREYESHAELIQKLKRDRQEELVQALKVVADGIDWPDLEQRLQSRAAEAP